jgi:hypothetical protein
MSEQLKAILKRKSEEIARNIGIGPETRYNSYKEELQFYVLNFIYHHPEYSKWIMYGGSALRIMHDLDRMSVDLDFETGVPISDEFLNLLKTDLEKYFTETYAADADFLTIKISGERGLLLKFHLNDELSAGHSSKQVHVKIDLNHFAAPKTVVERRPINHGQLSFVILTYNMGALMASKIAAIFLRGTRKVGDVAYEEKGRDIYDLLWYMGKRVIPDLDYLKAKGVDVSDMRTLFDKLTLQMNKVSDENLKNDLVPLFINRSQIEDWLKNWRESYTSYLENYKIRTIKKLERVVVNNDILTDVFHFDYWFKTTDEKSVRFIFSISYKWIDDREGILTIPIDNDIRQLAEFISSGVKRNEASKERQLQYATMFRNKIDDYLKKTKGVILGDAIATKFIEMSAFNKLLLLSGELDDLLK